MVHLTAADHRALLVVIVHAPRLDMQAQQVVEGFGDAHQLLAVLPVGGHSRLLTHAAGRLDFLKRWCCNRRTVSRAILTSFEVSSGVPE